MANEDIISSRENEIYTKRKNKLRLNRLSVLGGQAYIDARLRRAPNESDVSWLGDAGLPLGAPQTSFGMVGRKQRTTYVNDAGRVSGKLEQYLFKDEVARDGADEDFLANMGGRGVDPVRFWSSVNSEFTSGQWCWLQASRDSVAPSLRDRSAGDLVRWKVYPSLSVPDWCIDEDGELRWLIVESEEVENADPFVKAVKRKLRTLWRREDGGGVTMQRFWEAEGQRGAEAPVALGLNRLPFVLLGKPSADPWWFDDVEDIQAQMLNLDSVHVDNLIRTVYPQLVISAGTFDSLNSKLVEQYGADQGQRVLKVIKELVRGADTPIVEEQGEGGITRYIVPPTADLAALPNEEERKRRLMFDMVGLSLFNKETRQTQTAASKQFDQLDTNSTLKNRALLMQEAEGRLIEISKELDPAFADYEPNWPHDFDVPDTATDLQVIQLVDNLPDATPSMRKLALLSCIHIVGSMRGVDKALVEEARKEVRDADFELALDTGPDEDESGESSASSAASAPVG